MGKEPYSSSGKTIKGGIVRGKSISANEAMAGVGCQAGDFSSGMGRASNSFLHCPAIHRAHLFAFFLRALSVEIPVPVKSGAASTNSHRGVITAVPNALSPGLTR